MTHYLRSLGVKEETLVGISLEQSFELIVGILGILKAGGAYVPLDPEYPEERLQFMLEDTQTPVLITTRDIQERKYTGYRVGRTVLIDDEARQGILQEQSEANPTSITQGDNLAYVIYTSGSTGYPKGVMIEHRSIINCIYNFQNQLNLNADDKFLGIALIVFDMSILDFWGALICRETYILINPEEIKDHQKLKSVIIKTVMLLFCRVSRNML